MEELRRITLGAGVEGWFLPSRRFRTAGMRVDIERPLDAQTTAAALLQYVKRRGCRRTNTMRKIVMFLEDLYGASASVAVRKAGDLQILSATMQFLSERWNPARRVLGRAVEFLARFTLHPHRVGGVLPPDVVERERRVLRNELASLRDDRIRYAVRRCVEEMFAGEPYARHELGRLEEVEDPTPEGLTRLHEQMLCASPITIYAWGDFDADRMARRWQEALRIARRRPEAVPAAAGGRARGDVRELVERLHIEQSHVAMGFRLPLRWSLEEIAAAEAFHAVFGAFAHSRLFVHVRERLGLAYMVSSWLDTVKGFLCVVMGTLPETRARAVEEVLAQVRAIAQDGIAPAELDAARRSLEDRLVRMRDRPEAWLEAVAQMRAAGRVWQHEELLGAIRDVRPEDVVRVAANAQAGVVFVLEPAR